MSPRRARRVPTPRPPIDGSRKSTSRLTCRRPARRLTSSRISWKQMGDAEFVDAAHVVDVDASRSEKEFRSSLSSERTPNR